jgi:hypothetical protein
MSVDESRTCGKGLAERSALPARLSALTAAMADVLETHQQTLDLTDDHAALERAAYQLLVNDYRSLSSQLLETATRMVGYRDLPMARHHAHAMLALEIRGAIANLVQRERDVAALLETWIDEDEAMLALSKESP